MRGCNLCGFSGRRSGPHALRGTHRAKKSHKPKNIFAAVPPWLARRRKHVSGRRTVYDFQLNKIKSDRPARSLLLFVTFSFKKRKFTGGAGILSHAPPLRIGRKEKVRDYIDRRNGGSRGITSRPALRVEKIYFVRISRTNAESASAPVTRETTTESGKESINHKNVYFGQICPSR